MKLLNCLHPPINSKFFFIVLRTNVSLKDKKKRSFKFIRPYNLNVENAGPVNFYQDLEIYTSIVISKGMNDIGSSIRNYKLVCKNDAAGEEVLLDMLILGVLWEEYGDLSIPFLKIKKSILLFLYSRRKHPALKKHVDSVRGKLAADWLTGFEKKEKKPTMKELHRLRLFLQATCEFSEELKRVSGIIRYLEETDRITAEEALKSIVDFTRWFKLSSAMQLGKYTDDVHAFLQNHPENYKGREDYFFCGRKQPEYHLNMVGAEIMNRTLRKEFENTDEKILLLPTCMSIDNSTCRAKVIKGDLTCLHCNPDCKVSRTTREMRKKGIRTVLIRHSSSFSKSLKPWAHQKNTGLIGVACVLNLLTGGFEMKRLGIPSQCVFLDNPGCKKHWRSGKPSEVNLSAFYKPAIMKENNKKYSSIKHIMT